MAQQQNNQPQTGDTTNGPNIHTYIPRSDGTINIGGIVYAPQTPLPGVITPVATTPNTPIVVTAAPAVIAPITMATISSAPAAPMQSYFTPNGGSSVPIGPAGYSVFQPLPQKYPFALYTYQQFPYYPKASRFHRQFHIYSKYLLICI